MATKTKQEILKEMKATLSSPKSLRLKELAKKIRCGKITDLERIEIRNLTKEVRKRPINVISEQF